jgi:hypothetical protein
VEKLTKRMVGGGTHQKRGSVATAASKSANSSDGTRQECRRSGGSAAKWLTVWGDGGLFNEAGDNGKKENGGSSSVRGR